MDYYYSHHHHKKTTEKEETPKLTDLPGLGNTTAKKLNEEGIMTLEQLVALSPEQVDILDEKIKNFKANFEDWAKLSAEKIKIS